MDEQRFVRAPKEDDKEYGYWAWLDTKQDKYYVMYPGKDPNQAVIHQKMSLIFTDQAEYYAVCPSCRSRFGHMQWSGFTRNPGWRQESAEYLKEHIEKRGWCEFCDPIFGNGGWRDE